MIRRLAALAAAGLLLSACGSESVPTAVKSWVSQSAFHAAVSTLRGDAASAARELRDARATAVDLHTVCAVLDLESEQANASLPTPDDQSTELLSHAYDDLGAAAVKCYGAQSSAPKRAAALASLSDGVGYLAEASARIASLSS